MFKFEQEWIVKRCINQGCRQFSFSLSGGTTPLDDSLVEIIPINEWTPDIWATLAYSSLLMRGAFEAACLPYQLMDSFCKLCGGKDFGDKMPMFVFLIRSIVACHREVEPGVVISKKEAFKAIDRYRAV